MPPQSDPNAALHRAADRKTRRTGVRAAAFLVLAAAAAIGSAVLLTRYMDARTAAARVPTEQVLVAAIDLPVGAELRAEHLRAVAWPVASRPEGCFREPKELEGKVVVVRVYKGEPVLQAKLAGAESGGGLSALLPPGMRALAVQVNDVVGVAGFIHPGNTVDVIVTLRPEMGHAPTASKMILQNIKVLAVGKELDHGGGKGADKVVPATVATLMVDAEQSERLALAATQGKILLALRSGADDGTAQTRGVNSVSLLAGTEPPAPPKAPERPRLARRVPAAAPAAAPSGEVVEILRGDTFERRDFQKGAR